MSCNPVSTLKLLASNFLSIHINCLIYFSDRMKFYRLLKSFNGSINIRMQRHMKCSLHILQNAVNLTVQFVINLRIVAIFRAKGLLERKGLGNRLCLLSCWGGQQSYSLEPGPPAAVGELLLHLLCNKCILSPLSSCLCHHDRMLPAVLIHQ